VKLRIFLAGAILSHSFCAAQSGAAIVVENPTASQTIVQPSGTSLFVNSLENVQFADQYTSAQAAISALPPTGGTVYFPCGYSGSGPMTIPSNIALVSLCAPANANIAGSFGVSPNNTSTQVTLTYSSSLALTNTNNVYMKGITLSFGSGEGLILTSSQFNNFDDVTIYGGGTSQPVLQMLVTGSVGHYCGPGCNTVFNIFHNLYIQCIVCNYAIQLIGNGGINGITAGAAVTDNYFDGIVITGDVTNGIDFELNTDSNHWHNVFLNEDTQGAGTCGVTANASDVGTDIDADANNFTDLVVQGYQYGLCLGQSVGNGFEMESAANFVEGVHILGGTPNFTAHAIGLYEKWGSITTGAMGQPSANQLAGTSECASGTKPILLPFGYTSQPVILVFDETTKGGANLTAKSTSGFTVSCTGTSDVFDWLVIGNPN
jgi:hypothetical protein